MAWRYKLHAPFELLAPELMAVEFSCPWLEIRHCRLAIPEEYAWDGCSPSLRLPGGKVLPSGIWLGTWDGPLAADGRPVTWMGSLVHDALCQFRSELRGVSKAASVALFARLLREGGAPGWMCDLYPAAVDRFGPQSWAG